MEEENRSLEMARDLWRRLQLGVLSGFNNSEFLVDAIYRSLQEAALTAAGRGEKPIDLTALDDPELGRAPKSLPEMELALHNAARKAELSMAQNLLEMLKKPDLSEMGQEVLLQDIHDALTRAGIPLKTDARPAEIENVIHSAEVKAQERREHPREARG